MRNKTHTYFVRALWLTLLALCCAFVVSSACTPAQRQTVASDVKSQAETCSEEPLVKACIHAALNTCIGKTIIIEQDQCLTETTVARVAACFELCSHPPQGEAGAPEY